MIKLPARKKPGIKQAAREAAGKGAENFASPAERQILG
jgi:hypothetical protein